MKHLNFIQILFDNFVRYEALHIFLLKNKPDEHGSKGKSASKSTTSI
jgi:hypothetical protein